MNIAIPIKQVPETSNVKMDPETGTMIRDGVGTVVNPLDLYAIEVGIRLKERFGGRITVLSMGPRMALSAIREALAMGCDDGILVSDRKFAGSDTWATSYTLAQAIRKAGNFDLVLCGERATDGDTGQVGPGIAAWMDLPLATYVSRIDEIDAKSLIVERLVEEGYQKLRLPIPALLTVVKEIAAPRLPTLGGKKRAKLAEIPTFTAENMQLDESCIGLNGSPTRVVKIQHPKVAREGVIVRAADDESIDAAIENLVEFLRGKKIL
ncbi:MAG TPA: electron transfer flavoprotein subunit beta/FixA family protein [Spirochaetia bacterium]|nr:electron transfer flavoprotein subunit beta/FixA family protein [Spirochaetia bacterium]